MGRESGSNYVGDGKGHGTAVKGKGAIPAPIVAPESYRDAACAEGANTGVGDEAVAGRRE